MKHEHEYDEVVDRLFIILKSSRLADFSTTWVLKSPAEVIFSLKIWHRITPTHLLSSTLHLRTIENTTTCPYKIPNDIKNKIKFNKLGFLRMKTEGKEKMNSEVH